MSLPKFLAWDIGIKNLAYNIVEYDHKNKNDPFQIKEWGVINLVEEEQTIPNNAITFINCCMSNKTGKKCSQKAKFINPNDNSLGYCGKHQKEFIKSSGNKDIELIQIKAKMNCIQHNEKTDACCNKIGIWLDVNNPYMRYCQVHYKSIIKKNKELEKDYYMDPKHASKVKQFDIRELSIRLFNELEKRDYFLNVDNVIIENQPHEKNPRMKSVQMWLYSWFIMKGIMTNKIQNIKCFFAGKKLEGFTGNHEISKKFEHIKSKYKQTKNTSVLFCKEMIKEHQTDWYNFICKHSKADDLADTFMMNCCYIQDNHIKQLEKVEKQLMKKTIAKEKAEAKEKAKKDKADAKKKKGEKEKTKDKV